MNKSIFSPIHTNNNEKKTTSTLNEMNGNIANKIIFNLVKNSSPNESSKANIKSKTSVKRKIRTNNKPSQTNNKLGRKTKRSNENRENNHNCNSADNLFYKLKVNCMQYILFLLNSLLRKHKCKGKFLKIEGKIIRDGSKIFNQIFINSTIKTILKNYPISKKYKLNNPEKNHNSILIERIEKSQMKEKNNILEILNNTFYKIYENEYSKFSENQYFEKYNIDCKNKYLLYYHINDQKYLQDFVNYGILSYLEKKKERATIDKEYFKYSFE